MLFKLAKHNGIQNTLFANSSSLYPKKNYKNFTLQRE